VHFGVTHPSKKKLRVVLDAALKFRGSSLNDQLLTGISFTNLLAGVLIRFRRFAVALIADIDYVL
jgi:hypothetical protein